MEVGHTHAAALGIDLTAEAWQPRDYSTLPMAAPGQFWPEERYTERFARIRQETAASFTGITADGRRVPGLFPVRPTGVSTRSVRLAAEALLASFDNDERARIIFPVDTDEIRLWHGLFSRQLRHGLLVQDMADRQRERLADLLGTSLSAYGAAAVEDIRRTNELAGLLSARYRDLGHDLYWLSFMGTPSDTQPWGWQLDGHHVNITYFVLGDQVVMTPTFLGAEPTSVRTGKYAGIRLFEAEERAGLAVMRALTPEQQHCAMIANKIGPDLFTGFFRDDLELGYHGVAARDLSDRQKDLLLEVAAAYTAWIRPGHAEVRLDEIRRHLADAYFAWIGGWHDPEPFYYRFHSPVAIIEFTHVNGITMAGDAPSRNHVHTVVRTPNGNDYGRDLLRQHMEQAHRI